MNTTNFKAGDRVFYRGRLVEFRGPTLDPKIVRVMDDGQQIGVKLSELVTQESAAAALEVRSAAARADQERRDASRARALEVKPARDPGRDRPRRGMNTPADRALRMALEAAGVSL